MATVLVTGGNGHIGCNVVRALLEEGTKVRALVRPGSERRGLAGLDVELSEGDVLTATSLGAAASGVETVIHTAAVHRNFAADPGDFLRTAVDGTRNVLDACAAAGVKRLVLTSSGATVGFTDDPARPLDERHHFETARAPYIQAKVAQEKLALAERRLEVVVVNPTGVFGPNDFKLTPATRGFRSLLQGDPAFFAVTVTDVRDVARAHVLAARSGKAGERYLVAGDVLAPEQIAQTLVELVGFGPKVMRPPRFLVNTIAWWEEHKARSSGNDAAITREMIDDVWGRHLAYDAGRSRNELGMTYRPAKEVFRDTIAWLLQVGALAKGVEKKVRARFSPQG